MRLGFAIPTKGGELTVSKLKPLNESF